MRREDLSELHYITPIANLPSIFRSGLLCYRLAATLDHVSIADTDIQEIRDNKPVPGGKTIHDYVNLFLNARGPMMFRVCEGGRRHAHLAVLAIDCRVLDLPGVMMSDGNAASRYTRFDSPGMLLPMIDGEMLYAQYWTPQDPYERLERTRQRAAEVLIPGSVPPEYIIGVHTSCSSARNAIELTNPGRPVRISKHMFFLAWPPTAQ